MTKYILPLSVASALFASACASRPAVNADGLQLRRVVIYRNGVAYFEREGRVSADRVGFRVRGDEVADFLASFAVIEKGGSSVKAASFPLKHEEPTPPAVDEANKKPVDPKRRLETVVMELDGREHELAVGYIAEAPVWRPSYRLVLEKGQAHLQLWGIVQNLSGEDWKDARLTLVADAPLALATQLEKPVVPGRPVLTEGEGVIAVVPQSETSLAEAPPPPAPVAAAAPTEPMALRKMAPGADKGGKMRAKNKSADTEYDQDEEELMGSLANSIRPASAPSRPRNMAALAAVAVSGGATRYELPNPVSVPDNSATMLLLADKEVPGGATYLFAPDGGVPESAAHPFRVARFTNKTGGLLERGPLAFFGEAGFLGQGVIDPLPEDASATVPFGLERGLAVEHRVEYIQEGARLYQIEAGTLTIERQVGPRTTYIIKSGLGKAEQVLVKHARQGGSKLVNPPKGTEDNVGSGSALVPADVPARGRRELVIDERQSVQQGENWLSPLAEEAVKEYLASQNGKGEAATALKAAWLIHTDWKQYTDEVAHLHIEQENLQRSNEETRENLRAIEKNKAADDLRATLTDRLAKGSARLDEVVKRIIQREMQIKELELRFREAIKTVKIPPRISG
jgi:fructose-specific component phosphotransferase system IIB-like protein